MDEFYLVVHPVIAGQGRPWFPAGSLTDFLKLKLIHTRTFENGCVAHHYARKLS
ncbi:MAG: hypothetical protein ACO1NU_08315 [Arcticibacter sp.]